MEYETKDIDVGKYASLVSIDSESGLATDESKEYKEWLELSELPRALVSGTPAMQDGGEEFLPKHPLESTLRYNLRLEQSYLLPGFQKTCTLCKGQVFKMPIKFSDEVAEDFLELMQECDIAGNDINFIAASVFLDGLQTGAGHFLIDAPVAPAGLTAAQEKAQNIRPFIKQISPLNVIGGQEDESGQLTQIRIRSYVPVMINKYQSKQLEIVTVYNSDGSWEKYGVEEKKGGGEQFIDSGQLSYKGIPVFSFFPGKQLSCITGETPLIDLAYLNLAHWRSNSDQTNILSVARVPLLFGRNIAAADMPVGTSEMIVSTDDNADLKFVEPPSGTAIKAGVEDLQELKAQMALYGLQQLVPRVGHVTATEKKLSNEESMSSLAAWTLEFQEVLQAAFTAFQEMRNNTFPAAGCSLNTDYDVGIIDEVWANATLKAHDQGVVSEKFVFEEFDARGAWKTKANYEDIEAEKEAEQRKLAANNIDGKLFA